MSDTFGELIQGEPLVASNTLDRAPPRIDTRFDHKETNSSLQGSTLIHQTNTHTTHD